MEPLTNNQKNTIYIIYINESYSLILRSNLESARANGLLGSFYHRFEGQEGTAQPWFMMTWIISIMIV